MIEPWPLRHLVLRTPRLELRPADDAAQYALVAVAEQGIHPPEEMPFAHPWTDADPRYLGRGMIQYYWRCRAELGPDGWAVPFAVSAGGTVIGMQELSASRFAVVGEVGSGSWLGSAHQGQGYGTEMRAAVLAFAFGSPHPPRASSVGPTNPGLGARTARSAARPENGASLAVSRRLGYRPDGTEALVRRGAATVNLRLLLHRAEFVRPSWTLQVEGLDGVRELLGARW